MGSRSSSKHPRPHCMLCVWRTSVGALCVHLYQGLICLESFGCGRIKAFEGAKYHGSPGGRGLGDQLAGVPRRI